MKYFSFLMVSLVVLACNPTRELKDVVAFVGTIPPIQVMGGKPGASPEEMDPMRYVPYFSDALVKALNKEGIKTQIGGFGAADIKKPDNITIELGAVNIMDSRPPIPSPAASNPNEGLELTIMGGFGSVDKKGESVRVDVHQTYRLSDSELQDILKENASADPVKILIDKGTEGFAASMKERLVEHLKKNG
ncbi:hypothetical protein GC194_04530 [bacterium]|nr:hypothetical protein [bacterium]